MRKNGKFNSLNKVETYPTVIYLTCSENTCLERIKERARNEEKHISKDYLSQLEYNFQKLYLGPSKPFPSNAHVVDTDKTIGEVKREVEAIVCNISLFFVFFI